MHYLNNREAKEGDQVIFKDYAGKLRVGTLHSINAGAETCNAQIAYIVPGGIFQHHSTIGECLHAEDAFEAFVSAPKQPPTDTPSEA